MTSRIDGQRGHASHHAEETAQDAKAGAEHAGETHDTRIITQRKKLRAKIQHNKAQAAAFYRNKRFATSLHKSPTPSGQKLLRHLGQRPRPTAGTKERQKVAPKHEREAEGLPVREEKHLHEHRHEQGSGQSPGEERGQPRDEQGSPDSQQQRDGGKRPRKFALKVRKTGRKAALSNVMRSVAEQYRDSPELPRALADAYTKGVLQFTSQIEHGPLLAVPLMLSMASRMVLKRAPARLNAQYNGALAHGPADPRKVAATAGLLGLSLDLTLARQQFGVEYADADQSLATIKQRLIDALGGTPVAAKGPTIASDKGQQLRTVSPDPRTQA